MRRARYIYGHLDAARSAIVERSREIGRDLADDAAPVATNATLGHLELALRAIADELRDHDHPELKRYGGI